MTKVSLVNGPSDEAAARSQFVADMPDVLAVDNWPDIHKLPGRLISVLELLDARITLMHREGQGTEALDQMYATVHESREALIRLNAMSPLEAWRWVHPHAYDPLDGMYDCRGVDCPRTGFHSKEDKDLHYRRWDL